MPEIELSSAVIVHGPDRLAVCAARLIHDAVFERTRLRLSVSSALPANSSADLIVLGLVTDVDRFAPGVAGCLDEAIHTAKPEGFRLRIRHDQGRRIVLVVGDDGRGVLFGAGYLLRQLLLERDSVRLPEKDDVTSAPVVLLRGHQLGYRPKTNSYDGWNEEMWRQYYRDLVVFGANAVELIPPRSDDDEDSPHFPLPPLAMMQVMSGLADEYGLDCWIWYPAMDLDYTDEAAIQAAVGEWMGVLSTLPRVDAIFVPGGDPGHTRPEVMMRLLARQAEALRRFHPKAGWWVSPQGFTNEWMAEFLQILRDQELPWLTGLVYGPQISLSLDEMRRAAPARYPIRFYPDITHCYHCQYPVSDWDPAFCVTEGREPINPRPVAMRQVYEATREYVCGFVTYSEGCNDDVNKVVWSALGWNPDADLRTVLEEYGRYFVGAAHAREFGRILRGLEQNWVGSPLTNPSIQETLQRIQNLERGAMPRVKLQWRFQQAVYRAYYDAVVRDRLLVATAQEELAYGALRQAARIGSLPAIAAAEQALYRFEPVAADLRERVFELAEALFQSIRMQLSVPRYAAIEKSRGANLELIDRPLNNLMWLQDEFICARSLPTEKERLAAIEGILSWTDPGPDGFYDAPGDPLRRPHVVSGPSFAEDPSGRKGAHSSYAGVRDRIAWRKHGEALYDEPLIMRYQDLEAGARYRLRVVYGVENNHRLVRLMAGGIQLHPWQERPYPPRPIEFDIPENAIRDGVLELQFNREPGVGGNGRGCQVAEVWLRKQGS